MPLCAHNPRRCELTHTKLLADLLGWQQMHDAVNFRRICIAATLATFSAQCRRMINQHLHRHPHAAFQLLSRDFFRHSHEARQALIAHRLRQHALQFIGRSALHRAVGKAARSVNLRFTQKVEQMLKLTLRLARKARNKCRTDHDLWANLAPALNTHQILLTTGWPLHTLEHIRMAVLKRHIEIRQNAPGGHQRHDLVHMRIRIHVMQANPSAMRLGQLRQLFAQLKHACLHRLAIEEARAVFHIDAISRRVLADNEQLFDAAFKQRLGFF